jgi:putative ABC transport system permease protein
MYVYNLSEAQMEELRNHPAVSRSVICSSNQWNAIIPNENLSEEYLQACESYNDSSLTENENGAKYVNIHYIEDEAFRSYLEEHHINPDPYFDKQNPTALVMSGKIIVYKQNGQDTERLVYETPVFENFSGPLVMFDSVEPDAVHEYLENISPNYYWNKGSYQGFPMDIYRFSAPIPEAIRESTPYLQEDGSVSIVKVYENNDAGQCIIGYYLYDPSKDVLSDEPLATRPIPQNTPTPLLGETVDELPFGVTNYTRAETITLAMPLSMVNTEAYPPELRISINDYDAITAYLDEKGYDYGDLLESQMQYRNIVTMTNVFSYGFIILISLICICNVFNTISTNIALRRRDFGMLRSVGMQTKELNRMMIYECLRYGIRALVMGIPLGILGSFGINTLTGSVGNSNYEPPLIPMCIAIACVFVVVFLSMLYALSKLKKDNPIEAIRMENL